MKVLIQAHCTLGENPLWDDRKSCLYWTDIDGGTLHRYQAGRHDVIYHGEKVGGFTLQEDGSLLLFRVSDVAQLEPGHEAETLLEVHEEGMARFNDVTTMPTGDVLAGTIGRTKTSGGVYRVFQNGVLERLWDGTQVANGMGFSPDLGTFYWTDSTARHIYRFNYDKKTHHLSGRELIYEAPTETDVPDGLTVAADGTFFSARHSGGRVVHHNADGRILSDLPLDTKNVTSLTFGGDDLRTLYITTAAGEEPDSGAVFEHTFAADSGLKGRPAFRSRVLLGT